MKIAAAQTIPKDGNISANIADHLEMTEQAAERNVKLILFPEMSLTGYTRAGADGLAFVPNDKRLDSLKQLANEKGISIIASAPIMIEYKLHIGAFILRPQAETLLYTKQYLHTGEEHFFSPSNAYNPVFEINEERFSLAICADIDNSKHPEQAANNNTTCYLASLFYTPDGIVKGHELLSAYAQHYNMNVLMANYGGPSYNLVSGGRSAFWNKKGDLIAQSDTEGIALLIADTK